MLFRSVSELSDHQSSRKISGAGSNRNKEISRIRGGGAAGGNAGKRDGIKMPDGSIWTGCYSDWNELSKEDRQTVMDTRVKNKGKSPRKDTSSKNKLHNIKTKMAA